MHQPTMPVFGYHSKALRQLAFPLSPSYRFGSTPPDATVARLGGEQDMVFNFCWRLPRGSWPSSLSPPPADRISSLGAPMQALSERGAAPGWGNTLGTAPRSVVLARTYTECRAGSY